MQDWVIRAAAQDFALCYIDNVSANERLTNCFAINYTEYCGMQTTQGDTLQSPRTCIFVIAYNIFCNFSADAVFHLGSVFFLLLRTKHPAILRDQHHLCSSSEMKKMHTAVLQRLEAFLEANLKDGKSHPAERTAW